MMMCYEKRLSGFTLIEIMIVIAIIAILAVIAIPNFREARAEAQLEACRKNILAIANAIQMATMRCSYDDLAKRSGGERINDGYLNVATSTIFTYLIENDYLSSRPLCPTLSTGASAIYQYRVTIAGEGSMNSCGFWIMCGASRVKSRSRHFIGDKVIQPEYWAWTNEPGSEHNRTGWYDTVYDL